MGVYTHIAFECVNYVWFSINKSEYEFKSGHLRLFDIPFENMHIYLDIIHQDVIKKFSYTGTDGNGPLVTFNILEC